MYLVSCHREIVSLQTHQINITVRDRKTLHCVRGRVAEKEGMGKVGGKGFFFFRTHAFFFTT